MSNHNSRLTQLSDIAKLSSKVFFFSESYFLLFLCFLLGTASGNAQGRYDVRFTINQVDCATSKVYVDLEVRADASSSTFNIADQNYRISFNRAVLANPQIETELTLSSFTQTEAPLPASFSFYNPHSLTGSSDTIVSYNVELSGGDGYPLNSVDYVKVGRLAFNVLNFNGDMRLRYHSKDPNDFPPTVITEKLGVGLYNTNEGSYGNYYQNLGSACGNQMPNANNDNAVTNFGTSVTLNLLANDTDPENLLDPSSVVLTSVPPTSQGTVILNPSTGSITFSPAAGFFGQVNTFSYRVCDNGVEFPTAHGNLNTESIPAPNPNDPPMGVGNPECATALIMINVQVGTAPSLNVKVFLEGPYLSSGIMSTNLSAQGEIPTLQPYSGSPWFYNGTETRGMNNGITDWVLVRLRAEASSTTVIHSVAGLLRSDGQILSSTGSSTITLDGLVADSVYVTVFHRNHVGIMTAGKIGLSGGSFSVNFTNNPTMVFGGLSGTKQVEPGRFVMLSGDYNANGQVQNTDYNGMVQEIGLSGYRPGDCNLNSQSQNTDLQDALIPNIGRGASFPY